MWKGENITYRSLHSWIQDNKPKKKFCESCNKRKKLELANISGKYKRDINDYKWECHRCHIISHKKLITHCPKGHLYSKENTHITKKGYRQCLKCKKICWKKWIKDNRIKRKEYIKSYQIKNKEKINQMANDYYKNNKEEVTRKARERYWRHKK